ncbi:DUF6174 domain-containing protein [Nocardioides sp. YIM 152588]|uniref:DUF6174 domain-containing protein n=1 Tax=Nocardioides sp. YIM 152588 TaxID=3158259 RepID=UPI0032E4BD96
MRTFPGRRHRRHRRRLAAGALAVALAVALGLGASGCGGGDETATDTSGSATPASTGTTTGTTGVPTTDGPFTAQDYTYRLEVICFCPIAGPVEVTVRDGEVANAVVLRGPEKGQQAPEFYRLTIADIVAESENEANDEVKVVQPAGQAWPNRVSIDRDRRATDDEITYLVRDVRIDG